MRKYLRLIRPVNLYLIAIIQVLVQWSVIHNHTHDAELFSRQEFIYIIIITVLAGAAGYVVNDIFDVDIDVHNKPGKNIVGDLVPKSVAWAIYGLLVGAGAVLTWLLGEPFRIPGLIFYILTTVVLFSYSAYFKRTLIIGNIIVSIFAAMVVYVLWIGQDLIWQGSQNSSAAFDIVLMYTLFAFGSTLIREIVKDIEDVKGDATAGARTLPNTVGVDASRNVCMALSILFGIGLAIWLWGISGQLSERALWYFIILVILPVFGIVFLSYLNDTKRQWYITSQYIKGVIFLGTAFLLLL